MAKPKAQGPARNELWPKVIGTGPKLRLQDGKIRVSIGSNATEYPLGSAANQAESLVTYTSEITRASADSLTFEGKTVIGWLLMDGEGQVLGRLVNDDDVVYEPDQAKNFARRAGLQYLDWGHVEDKRIDRLMKTPRTDRTDKTLGVTRREWLLFAAVFAGIFVTWPFLTHFTFTSVRGQSLVLFGTALGAFGVGALGLFLARKLAVLPDKVLLPVGLVVAAILGVSSAVLSVNGATFWRLSPSQTGAVVLGLAGLVAVMPFWARGTRGIVLVKPADLSYLDEDEGEDVDEDVDADVDDGEDDEDLVVAPGDGLGGLDKGLGGPNEDNTRTDRTD